MKRVPLIKRGILVYKYIQLIELIRNLFLMLFIAHRNLIVNDKTLLIWSKLNGKHISKVNKSFFLFGVMLSFKKNKSKIPVQKKPKEKQILKKYTRNI